MRGHIHLCAANDGGGLGAIANARRQRFAAFVGPQASPRALPAASTSIDAADAINRPCLGVSMTRTHRRQARRRQVRVNDCLELVSEDGGGFSELAGDRTRRKAGEHVKLP
jgi:hypothetical protein